MGVLRPYTTGEVTPITTVFLGAFAGVHQTCKAFHQEAVESSVEFAKVLKSKGFTPKEILKGAEIALKRQGCPGFSWLYIDMHKKTLRKMANGEKIKQGVVRRWISKLFDKKST